MKEAPGTSAAFFALSPYVHIKYIILVCSVDLCATVLFADVRRIVEHDGCYFLKFTVCHANIIAWAYFWDSHAKR
jgi:hypothetical protein